MGRAKEEGNWDIDTGPAQATATSGVSQSNAEGAPIETAIDQMIVRGPLGGCRGDLTGRDEVAPGNGRHPNAPI